MEHPVAQGRSAYADLNKRIEPRKPVRDFEHLRYILIGKFEPSKALFVSLAAGPKPFIGTPKLRLEAFEVLLLTSSSRNAPPKATAISSLKGLTLLTLPCRG